MRSFSSRITAALVSAALLGDPVAAASPSRSSGKAAPASPWLALSMLDTSGAVGLGEVAVQPPPRPQDTPRPGVYQAGGIPTPVIAFWVLTVAAMIYIATRDSSGHIRLPVPNSPA